MYGRRIWNRDVVSRMSPIYISRLFLFIFISAVWETRAKSLPDQGALGKLTPYGMLHNEGGWEWLRFKKNGFC